MRAAVSADWVLPVDGPPLKDAFVAWEDGRMCVPEMLSYLVRRTAGVE